MLQRVLGATEAALTVDLVGGIDEPIQAAVTWINHGLDEWEQKMKRRKADVSSNNSVAAGQFPQNQQNMIAKPDPWDSQ